jgi:hypothetical protein
LCGKLAILVLLFKNVFDREMKSFNEIKMQNGSSVRWSNAKNIL